MLGVYQSLILRVVIESIDGLYVASFGCSFRLFLLLLNQGGPRSNLKFLRLLITFLLCAADVLRELILYLRSLFQATSLGILRCVGLWPSERRLGDLAGMLPDRCEGYRQTDLFSGAPDRCRAAGARYHLDPSCHCHWTSTKAGMAVIQAMYNVLFELGLANPFLAG